MLIIGELGEDDYGSETNNNDEEDMMMDEEEFQERETI